MKQRFKNNFVTKLLIFGSLTGLSSTPAISAEPASSIKYPVGITVKQVDTYHGTVVQDPYRWLEDPHSKETKTWIERENKITENFLKGIKIRNALKDRLNSLWDYPKHSIPFEQGGRLFYLKNTGLQDQDVLYVKNKNAKQDRVLIDPNKLSEDGTVSLSSWTASDDGKYLAYSISKAGSDWQEWFVRNVDTGEDLEDHLKWVKFSGASFKNDGSGFYYSRYKKPDEKGKYKSRNYYQKLYFHKLGTKQEEDKLVYERKDQKEWGFDGSVTEDGQYLIIHVWKGTEEKNRVFYKEIGKKNSKVIELLNKQDAHYDFVGNNGSLFYFQTNKNAPKSKLVSTDIKKFNGKKVKFKTIVPESKDTLVSASLVGNRFLLKYLTDAFSSVKQYTPKGKFISNVKLPGIGTVYGFGGKQKDKFTYYGYTSFNTPTVVHKLNIDTGEDTIIFKPVTRFNPEDFTTKQVFVKSKDGTKIPLFISSKKGIKLDGSNPTYLYGYGGFNISKVPRFSVTSLTWMEMGGIFAQACLRGGGEYGESWHQQGMKLNKQNVFDDFISCGEWLIKEKYTSKEKLAIAGGSNGGLLVGACLTQRPDLFGAACPSVGVMDMLRFHKFTIGWGWVSDYGCADNKDEFKALYAYSPLHNIKAGTSYPPTFITTADHDDRVVPAHSFKFAATLQKAQKGKNPILIRIETKAGHGGGKPTSKIIEETTDKFAFLARVLNFEKQASENLSITEEFN